MEDKEKALTRLTEENAKKQVSAIAESETIKKAWSNGKNSESALDVNFSESSPSSMFCI